MVIELIDLIDIVSILHHSITMLSLVLTFQIPNHRPKCILAIIIHHLKIPVIIIHHLKIE